MLLVLYMLLHFDCICTWIYPLLRYPNFPLWDWFSCLSVITGFEFRLLHVEDVLIFSFWNLWSRSSGFMYFCFLALCIFRLQYQDGTESVGSQQVSQWEATPWPRGVCLSSTLTPVWSGSSAPEHKTSTQHQVRELLVALERTLGFFSHGKLYNNRTTFRHRRRLRFFRSVVPV